MVHHYVWALESTLLKHNPLETTLKTLILTKKNKNRVFENNCGGKEHYLKINPSNSSFVWALSKKWYPEMPSLSPHDLLRLNWVYSLIWSHICSFQWLNGRYILVYKRHKSFFPPQYKISALDVSSKVGDKPLQLLHLTNEKTGFNRVQQLDKSALVYDPFWRDFADSTTRLVVQLSTHWRRGRRHFHFVHLEAVVRGVPAFTRNTQVRTGIFCR